MIAPEWRKWDRVIYAFAYAGQPDDLQNFRELLVSEKEMPLCVREWIADFFDKHARPNQKLKDVIFRNKIRIDYAIERSNGKEHEDIIAEFEDRYNLSDSRIRTIVKGLKSGNTDYFESKPLPKDVLMSQDDENY